MEQKLTDVLRREETITLELRALYEQYGYRKYRMGKFEEYELYLENKNFLKSKNIITFHDLDGRVLALKPDVTLSIAKNTHATENSSEKFYYLENVYRLDKPSGSYREISQLGLEYIGKLDGVAAYEVLCLARQTLSKISGQYRIQLSHVGFLLSLLDGLGMEAALRQEILEYIRGKRAHELKNRLEQAGVAQAAVQLLAAAAGLCGEFAATLRAARGIAITQAMTDALNELENVYTLLEETNQAEHIMLDFSLVGDSDYYGGLIFQGYVEGVPRALLAGGYYGNLLKKFGRNLDAIGFAVYLNELDLLFRGQKKTDVDALVLYGEKDAALQVIRAAQGLMEQGLRVRLERAMPDEISCRQVYRFKENGLEEVKENA